MKMEVVETAVTILGRNPRCHVTLPQLVEETRKLIDQIKCNIEELKSLNLKLRGKFNK